MRPVCNKQFDNSKTHCPVCGASSPFNNLDEINDYILLRYNSCDSEFADSMHYNAAYYEKIHYAEDDNLNYIFSLSREQFIKKANKLIESKGWQPHNVIFKWLDKNFKQGVVVLDIGCGSGWLIAALQSNILGLLGSRCLQE